MRLTSRMHPFRAAVGPVLSLPNRHELLQAIDGVPAGVKGFIAVRATDGDGDADLAQAHVSEAMHHHHIADGPTADVDLLIRTGGERRLSDFMLWECAYAELFFTPRMWPEFEVADLAEALDDFLGRERRFGRLPEAAAS